jgi:NTP pyrophosphatase (non-canonical NTP hydrolase)
MTEKSQLEFILKRIGQSIETGTEKAIWEQIKMVIVDEGKFNVKDWTLREKPAQIIRINGKVSFKKEVTLEPSPFKGYKPVETVRELLLLPENEIKINDLASITRMINDHNGFTMTKKDLANEHFLPAKIALIHSEASEMLEEYRNSFNYRRSGRTTFDNYDVDNHKDFEFELADIIIRCLDIASGLNIPIGIRIAQKLEKNAKRGYKHGNKVV